jgi:hypothetical protein
MVGKVDIEVFLNPQSYRNISTVFKFKMRTWTVYVEQMWVVKKAYKISVWNYE